MVKHGTLSPNSIQTGSIKQNTAAPLRCFCPPGGGVLSFLRKEQEGKKEHLKSSKNVLLSPPAQGVDRGAQAEGKQGSPIPRMLEWTQDGRLWL